MTRTIRIWIARIRLRAWLIAERHVRTAYDVLVDEETR